MKNYSYPRVVTSVTALNRSSTRPEAEDTTVLFVPIISKTGPEREIVKIHSLEEYRSTFGIDKRLGLTLLNISNWLTAGGTIYAYRLVDSREETTTPRFSNSVAIYNERQAENIDETLVDLEVTSKYSGDLLNGYSIQGSLSGRVVTFKLIDPDTNLTVEKLSLSVELPNSELNETEKDYKFDVSKKSEYLKEIKFTLGIVSDEVVFMGSSDDVIDAQFDGGTDGWADSLDKTAYELALEFFWGTEGSTELANAIGNRLETPIDLIMDANYNIDIKKGMIKAISHYNKLGEVDAIRPDIRGYFDIVEVIESDPEESAIASTLGLSDGSYKETANLFFYDQWFLISEEAYFDQDMKVYPSYFLSKLIPAIDLNPGIQFPVAGKRRAELEGIKKLSKNPIPDEKELLFKARVNYVEKDSRGYYFMSQRTFDGSTEDKYTALSFINNSRVTCRMVHELERLGRDYLFEFNDAVTLANMSAVMNRYVTNWISNRTLSFGNVVVSADPYSDERVNAVLNIKFTGTIEVISIDLILQ